MRIFLIFFLICKVLIPTSNAKSGNGQQEPPLTKVRFERQLDPAGSLIYALNCNLENCQIDKLRNGRKSSSRKVLLAHAHTMAQSFLQVMINTPQIKTKTPVITWDVRSGAKASQGAVGYQEIKQDLKSAISALVVLETTLEMASAAP